MKTKNNIGIILAGGSGTRFGAGKPKQYLKVLGREVISYPIEAFKKSRLMDDFVVVLDSTEFRNGHVADKYGVRTVEGGSDRRWSIYNALKYVEKTFKKVGNIVINNACSVMTEPEWVDDIIQKLEIADYVVTAMNIDNGLNIKSASGVERNDYFLSEDPIGYRFDMFRKSFDPNTGSRSVSLFSCMPDNAKRILVYRDRQVLKITYPPDIKIAEAMLRWRKRLLEHDDRRP